MGCGRKRKHHHYGIAFLFSDDTRHVITKAYFFMTNTILRLKDTTRAASRKYPLLFANPIAFGAIRSIIDDPTDVWPLKSWGACLYYILSYSRCNTPPSRSLHMTETEKSRSSIICYGGQSFSSSSSTQMDIWSCYNLDLFLVDMKWYIPIGGKNFWCI